MRFIFIACCCFSFVEASLQVEMTAHAAMLMNADTGAVLYEKAADALIYPASTTKIATALFVLAEKQIPMNQVMTVSAESMKLRPLNKKEGFPPYWWDTDGSRMSLKIGETVSLDSLLHGLLLVSGNDAANVIAENVSGSIPAFMEELNAYLKKIGCQRTRFLNPHGCHHPEHVSTAHDLCLITQAALRLETFRDIVAKPVYMKPRSNKQGPCELKHTNRLLQSGPCHYSKAIGVKTGFHSAAQYCLVAAAVHEGRMLIAAILGTPNSIDRYTDAIRLFEAAFAETKETRCLFQSEHLFKRKVADSKTELAASLQKDLAVSFFPSEEPLCRAFVYWAPMSLPIYKGQRVGEIRVVDDKGKILETEGLFAQVDVKGTFLFRCKEAMRRLF